MNEKIIITTSSFGKYDRAPLEMLEENKIEYTLNPYGRQLTEHEVISLGENVTGIIAGTETLSDYVFSNLARLKVISRCGVGTDNIDIDAAEKRGIRVYNVPSGPTVAVAELTVGLILCLLRKTNQMDSELRSGIWKKRMGNLLSGKKIGIVGFGRIGRKVAELLEPFGVEIGYHDVIVASRKLPWRAYDLHALLAWADITTIHSSTSNQAAPVIGDQEIQLMNQGSWLVNVARGGVVDEQALYAALKSGHLGGAALDVFKQEPYNGPLKSLENVILTPHIGSYAREARVEMELQAVKNLLEGMGEPG